MATPFTTLNKSNSKRTVKKMSQYSCLCYLPKSIRNIEEKPCPIYNECLFESHFLSFRENRCSVKFFLGPIAQLLG